jgi:hypothetical protein
MPMPNLRETADRLAEQWVNGNASLVTGELEVMHPFAAAAVAVEVYQLLWESGYHRTFRDELQRRYEKLP